MAMAPARSLKEKNVQQIPEMGYDDAHKTDFALPEPSFRQAGRQFDDPIALQDGRYKNLRYPQKSVVPKVQIAQNSLPICPETAGVGVQSRRQEHPVQTGE